MRHRLEEIRLPVEVEDPFIDDIDAGWVTVGVPLLGNVIQLNYFNLVEREARLKIEREADEVIFERTDGEAIQVEEYIHPTNRVPLFSEPRPDILFTRKSDGVWVADDAELGILDRHLFQEFTSMVISGVLDKQRRLLTEPGFDAQKLH